MRVTRWISSALLAFAFLCFAAASAGAADQIYWGNEGAESISHANIAGGGGGRDPDHRGRRQPPRRTRDRLRRGQDLLGEPERHRILDPVREPRRLRRRHPQHLPAPVFEPHGLAIYPAAGRIYWANWADPNDLLRKARRIRRRRTRRHRGASSNSPSASPSTPPRTASTGRTSTAANTTSTSRTSTGPAAAARSTSPGRTSTCRGRSPSMARPTASTGRTPATRRSASPARTAAKAVTYSPTASRPATLRGSRSTRSGRTIYWAARGHRRARLREPDRRRHARAAGHDRSDRRRTQLAGPAPGPAQHRSHLRSPPRPQLPAAR